MFHFQSPVDSGETQLNVLNQTDRRKSYLFGDLSG